MVRSMTYYVQKITMQKLKAKKFQQNLKKQDLDRKIEILNLYGKLLDLIGFVQDQ